MMPDFEKLLQAMLPARGKTSLTLTEVPSGEDQLLQMLETAFASGKRTASRLTEIHLPMRSFPRLGNRYQHIRVADTGSAGVVRLVFET